jgi:uncharacterized membrane protein YesL
VAAHDVCLRMVDDVEGRVVRTFFRAFRAALAQGTVLWLLNAAAAYALFLDWQIVVKSDSPSIFLIIVSIVSTAFVFFAFLYAYPQVARYRTTVRRALMNSISISSRYILRTLLLVVLLALEIGLFWWNLVMIVIGVAIGPMILIYTVSGISRRIFRDIEGSGGSTAAAGDGA